MPTIISLLFFKPHHHFPSCIPLTQICVNPYHAVRHLPHRFTCNYSTIVRAHCWWQYKCVFIYIYINAYMVTISDACVFTPFRTSSQIAESVEQHTVCLCLTISYTLYLSLTPICVSGVNISLIMCIYVYICIL